MNLLDRIMQAVRGVVSAEIEGVTAPVQRTLHIEDIYRQLDQWAMAQTGGMYFVNLYVEDNGSLYALFGQDGKLFRAHVTISENVATAGRMQEVQKVYEPVSRSNVVMRELPSGDVRFLMVAATAIVNRVGKIDSTALFDNFIRRAEELQFYPRLDFYHLGMVDPAFEFGQFDFLARDGVSYIVSGIMDGEHPLTKMTMKRYRNDPQSLGASIEFFPIVGAYEEINVDGVPIQVGTDGVNTRISVLFEKDAAGWFTSLAIPGDLTMEQRKLDKAALDKLRQYFDGDEEMLKRFMGSVEGITRTVEELGLVARSGEDTAETEAEPTEEQPAEEPGTVLEIDDETIGLIADQVVRKIGEGALATVNGAIEKLAKDIGKLTANVDALAGVQRKISDRVQSLETDEDDKRREWLGDLPARQRTVTVTHRPRDERHVEDLPKTSDQIAASTLASIPMPPGLQP